MQVQLSGNITDINGLQVGHAEHPEAATGCTVVLAEAGAVAGVQVLGAAPGTRETDALHPLHLVEQVHAVLLTGGSAFGLEAAGGVMSYLEERGCGFPAGGRRVPIVPAAVIFDLDPAYPQARPDAALAYRACQAATRGPVLQGRVGAGRGAMVGKILGPDWSMPGGVGHAALAAGDLVVAALVVVNALGDVIGPHGEILAGARRPDGGFLDTLAYWREHPEITAGSGHTTIGVVATNARLNKAQASWVARVAHDGLARSIRPSHTLYDGDALFALATGEVQGAVALVGALAAESVAAAVRQAVSIREG